MLIAASGTVLGKAVIDANAVVDDAKVALYNKLFQAMGDKFLEIVLSADKKNDYNTLSEFEKRKHDDRGQSSATTGQQQKAATSSTFMPDPDDLDTNKPIILTTPIPSEKPITILSTQDQGKLLQKLGTLPGFNPAPSESIDTNTKSLPIHEQNWQDLILESRMSDKVNKPYPAAEGREHTVIKVGPDGKITNYGTYEVNPKNPTGLDLVKRVDLIGDSHFNKITGQDVPTPHVVGRGILGGVRPATADEIPRGKK